KVGNLKAALRQTPQLVEPYLYRLAEARGHAFAALNHAFWEDGLFLMVPAGTTIEKPIHILHVMNDAAGHTVAQFPRHLLIAGDGAQFTVVEDYVGLTGDQTHLSCPLTEIEV